MRTVNCKLCNTSIKVEDESKIIVCPSCGCKHLICHMCSNVFVVNEVNSIKPIFCPSCGFKHTQNKIMEKSKEEHTPIFTKDASGGVLIDQSSIENVKKELMPKMQRYNYFGEYSEIRYFEPYEIDGSKYTIGQYHGMKVITETSNNLKNNEMVFLGFAYGLNKPRLRGVILKDGAHPEITKMTFIGGASYYFFKTSPHQFPNLQEIDFTSFDGWQQEYACILWDLLANNPNLQVNPPKIKLTKEQAINLSFNFDAIVKKYKAIIKERDKEKMRIEQIMKPVDALEKIMVDPFFNQDLELNSIITNKNFKERYGLVGSEAVYVGPDNPVKTIIVPKTLFMVDFKRMAFLGFVTDEQDSYETITNINFYCSRIKYFKTYPNQFPNLKIIKIGGDNRSLSNEMAERILLDLLKNNPSLRNDPPKILFSDGKTFVFNPDRYDFSLCNNAQKQGIVQVKNVSNQIELVSTFSNNANPARLKEETHNKIVEIKTTDFPKSRTTKHFTFVMTPDCKNIEELTLGEGIDVLEIDPKLDCSNFALYKITIPSTIAVSTMLPLLKKFPKLMFVMIKPSKSIQVKCSGLQFIVCNLKKKKYDSLFYTYSYNGVNSYMDNPFGAGSYGGLTYISSFKEDKLIHYNDACYYLVDDGQAYRLVKTDKVDNFQFVKQVNGIPVKYVDPDCFGNVKNSPVEGLTSEVTLFNQKIKVTGFEAFIEINNLKIMME